MQISNGSDFGVNIKDYVSDFCRIRNLFQTTRRSAVSFVNQPVLLLRPTTALAIAAKGRLVPGATKPIEMWTRCLLPERQTIKNAPHLFKMVER